MPVIFNNKRVYMCFVAAGFCFWLSKWLRKAKRCLTWLLCWTLSSVSGMFVIDVNNTAGDSLLLSALKFT